MASAKRFSFDSWYNDYESLPEHGEVLWTQPDDDMIDVTITCNGHTHKYVYSYEDEEEMRPSSLSTYGFNSQENGAGSAGSSTRCRKLPR